MAAYLGRVDEDVVSQAVTAWFRFYELDPDELYAVGYHSADDLATSLIGTYVGRWSLMVNAPTSASVH